MACETILLPGGQLAIVCSRRRSRRRRCSCGRPAELLCDWKLDGGRTCDEPVCARCTTSPAPDKDLCRTHALAFDQWKAARSAVGASRGAA